MFAHYEVPVFTNDLLTLMYILEDNVGKVVFTSQMDPKVIPKIPGTSRYREVLSTFQSFLGFYDGLCEEGEYSEIITYYRLKHARLSFIALHSKYMQLRREGELERNAGVYYNEGLYETLLECNEYVSNRSPSDIFLAPLYMSRFLRDHGEFHKSRALRREARRIAKTSNRLEALQDAEDNH